MRIRRQLARKTVDMSELEINCTRAVVQLSGKLKEPRGFKGRMNLQEELESIIELIRRIPEVKDIICNVQIEGQPFRRAGRR
jgi:hypothetical protein